MRDAFRGRLLVAPYADEPDSRLPAESDFVLAADHRSCTNLALLDARLVSNGASLESGVSVAPPRKGEPVQRVMPTGSGGWRVFSGDEAPPKPAPAAPPAGSSAEPVDPARSQEAVRRARAEANERAGSRFGYVLECMERGRFDTLALPEVKAFHNTFLGHYSDCCGATIVDPHEFVSFLEEVETNEFGVESRRPIGKTRLIRVPERFAAKYDEYSHEPLTFGEVLGEIQDIKQDVVGAVDRRVQAALADRAFLQGYLGADRDDAAVERVLENLYRASYGLAPLYDEVVPTADGPLRLNLAAHSEPILRVAFSPDGGTVVSCDAKRFWVWDAADGSARRTLSPGFVTSLAFRDDGSGFAFTRSGHRAVQVWSSAGEPTHTIERARLANGATPANASAVCFDRDGRLWVGDELGVLQRFDAASGAVLQEFRSGPLSVREIALLPGGDGIASLHSAGAAEPAQVRRWTLDGAPLRAFDDVPPGTRWGGALGAGYGARWLPEGGVEVAALDDGSRIRLGRRARPATSFAFSADRRMLAVGHEDGVIDVWNLADRERRATLTGHRGAVRGVAFAREGGRLVSGGDDRNVLVWRVPD